ncbi:MAG: hypothetical protein QXV06_05540 [Ignisphaera sp.]
MFFRICRAIDKVSQHVSEPLTLFSLILAKDKKLIKILNTSSKKVQEVILESIKSSSNSSVTHYRLTIDNNIVRVFMVKDIVIASTKEDESGQIISYGANVVDEFSKILFELDVPVGLLIEEIPFKSVDQILINFINQCIEEAEKPHIAMWRSKGLYWFRLEELISEKGGYTYVFRARDVQGDVYVLKIFKEDIVINRDFLDLTRGYVQAIAVNSINEEEFVEIVKLKGYDIGTLRELYHYKKYVPSIKALIIPKEKLDKNTYSLYPPTIVEEYASMGDLETYIQKNGTRGLEEAMYTIIRISGATALAHLVDIPHLDIKSRNILLFGDAQEKYGYAPKITDFSGALGNIVHGFKIVRLTPGYADPLALSRGTSDFSYDVYSIAMVSAYILSGDVPRHRLILNILLLQNIYGYPIPMEKIKEEEKPLKEFVKKALDMVLQLKAKALSWQDFTRKINDELEPLDSLYMPWLNEIPKSITNILKKSLTMHSDARYKNCIEMWLDLREALIKEDMEKILVKK